MPFSWTYHVDNSVTLWSVPCSVISIDELQSTLDILGVPMYMAFCRTEFWSISIIHSLKDDHSRLSLQHSDSSLSNVLNYHHSDQLHASYQDH